MTLKLKKKEDQNKTKVTIYHNFKRTFFSTIDQVQSFGKSRETPERSGGIPGKVPDD